MKKGEGKHFRARKTANAGEPTCECGKCPRCYIRKYMRKKREDVTVKQYIDAPRAGNPALRHESGFPAWSAKRKALWQRRAFEILGILAAPTPKA